MTKLVSRNLCVVLLIILLLVFEAYFASQVYEQASNASLGHEVFNLYEEANSFQVGQQENAKNSSFQLEGNFLHIYSERGETNLNETVFDAYAPAKIILRKDLAIRYSFSTSKLNFTTDATHISLLLSNGSDFITLTYAAGFKEQNRVPDVTDPLQSYIFYQLGNATTLFEGQRNIWNDLTLVISPLTEHSWTITKISLGVISYQDGHLQDHAMEAFFYTSQNLLYYETLTCIKVTPDTRISWLMLSLMGLDMLLLFVLYRVVLKSTQGRLENTPYNDTQTLS